MLLWIAIVLAVIWGIGFLLFHIGAIFHLVLVAAIVLFIWHLVSGRARAG